MAGTFDFAPNGLVPETLPPEAQPVVSLNGWTFGSRPSVPYQKKFKVTLHGMRWYLQANGLFDVTTDPLHNARRLELFYEANGVWDKFSWNHPHLGVINARFSSSLAIPAGLANSYGLIPAFEVNLLHHDPGY